MRTTTMLLTGWQFGACPEWPQGGALPTVQDWADVTLPHVWNRDNPTEEGVRAYRRTVTLLDAGAPHYLEFEAVAGRSAVWCNGVLLGEHRGGYSTFRVALQGAAHDGDNEILVLTDNRRSISVLPTGGDFNPFGGIYRAVRLIGTAAAHFDLLYHGTSGVLLRTGVQGTTGTVQLTARVVGAPATATVEYQLRDGDRLCATATVPAHAADATLRIEAPHLWQGRRDPHLYTCTARLLVEGQCTDEVTLPCGFRALELTPDRGFFLNGEHLKLCGVSKHQDRAGSACAMTSAELQQDMDLIAEIGANAVRLSHYQHPAEVYDLCDRMGFVVWAEIPLLALPDGDDALFANARDQLTELILQNLHHPAICFWGLQNEIAIFGETLEMYRKIEELQALARSLDDSRPTTLANLYCVKNQSQLNHISDMVGYNIYYGWYYGKLTDYGPFLDAFHRDNPTVPVGISEYGADCTTALHSDDPKVGDYSEEFQCVYHEAAYPAVRARDFVWGSFVWNMFDFASGIRSIGEVKGLNCKGLVTYDRATRKDAFYYYKAWWSQEPFVHLCGRRYARRCGEVTTVKVYSNQPSVTLYCNGTAFATLQGERVFCFENVPLQAGDTVLTAQAGEQRDTMTLTRVAVPEPSYHYDNPNPGFNVDNWFTMEQGEDELFPADRFSLMDEMCDLMASTEAWALLEAEIPRIISDPRSKRMPHMTLLRILNRVSGQFEEEFVKELNRKLNAIPKPGKEAADD